MFGPPADEGQVEPISSGALAAYLLGATLILVGLSLALDVAGAASGLVNVAHQLGGALGLGLLVLVFAGAAPAAAQDSSTLAHRISAVMDAGALLLGLALLVSWLLIVRPQRRARARQQEALL